MMQWLRALFAWRAVRSLGVWLYLENSVTGRRKAIWRGGGHGPIDLRWLRRDDIVDGPRGRYRIGSDGELRRG